MVITSHDKPGRYWQNRFLARKKRFPRGPYYVFKTWRRGHVWPRPGGRTPSSSHPAMRRARTEAAKRPSRAGRAAQKELATTKVAVRRMAERFVPIFYRRPTARRVGLAEIDKSSTKKPDRPLPPATAPSGRHCLAAHSRCSKYTGFEVQRVPDDKPAGNLAKNRHRLHPTPRRGRGPDGRLCLSLLRTMLKSKWRAHL